MEIARCCDIMKLMGAEAFSKSCVLELGDEYTLSFNYAVGSVPTFNLYNYNSEIEHSYSLYFFDTFGELLEKILDIVKTDAIERGKEIKQMEIQKVLGIKPEGE